MAQELLPPEPQRDEKGRWQPGCDSPNPQGAHSLKGKARWDMRVDHFLEKYTVDDLQRILLDKSQRRNFTLSDWQILIHLKNTVVGKVADISRERERLYDRMWGKPIQTVLTNEIRRVTKEDMSRFTAEEAAQAYEQSLRE